MNEMLDKALGLGMKEDEYHRVVKILGREPTVTELAMYSVEWSEHCGYPRSRSLLKLLPKKGKYASTVGADTGGIEIEPGLTVVFKMESHNHPSQVEPKHGAATGIGGIVRDIFTVGARPIACLDSLRFGDLRTPLGRYLLHGVVEGISFYGNCIGIPTVGGEVGFNSCYQGNCLVGVMAVGLVRTDQIASSAAKGAGNSVMYFGNSTGRDGIGGCSILASHEFGEDEQKRPTVQIGDPFTEKCLIEACLEALPTGGFVSLKDMGAAGLTCTTCEQAAEGEVGMDIDLALVPCRETGMEPYEMMMSESQERMLGVVHAGREEEIAAIYRKWGLNAVVIGKVTDDGILTVRYHGEVVASIPAASLADPPIYSLPVEEPPARPKVPILTKVDGNEALLKLLASPNITSKSWVYEQYDHMVQTNTLVLPGKGDAAVLRIKAEWRADPTSEREIGIAATTDCNSRYCYLDPYVGAQIAVAEAARNLVCVGAEPAGVTDCLCFGNPEKPDRFWQFKKGIEGIIKACDFFSLPVVSGNVSFYNETMDSAIHPSPLIGMIGVLKDLKDALSLSFKKEGDIIALLGESHDELGGSEYLAVLEEIEAGQPPALDLVREQSVQQTVLEAAQKKLLSSAHDCSEGGLAVTLAECCLEGHLGAHLRIEQEIHPVALLFGESQSRIVISFDEQHLETIETLALAHEAPFRIIGRVGGNRLTLTGMSGRLIDLSLEEMTPAYRESIARLMEE